MATFVSVNSGFFRLTKASIYAYVAGLEQQARDLGKDFQRPMIVDHDVQVAADALKKRAKGDKNAVIERTQKVNSMKSAFLNNWLEDTAQDMKKFLRTPITLRQAEQREFLKDARKVMEIGPERRRALLDLIRDTLPKVEGLGYKQRLATALDSGNVDDFIEFTDVQEDGEEGGDA